MPKFRAVGFPPFVLMYSSLVPSGHEFFNSRNLDSVSAVSEPSTTIRDFSSGQICCLTCLTTDSISNGLFFVQIMIVKSSLDSSLPNPFDLFTGKF